MKEFLVSFVKLLLSVLILIFGREYFFKLLDLINLNVSGINENIISLIIYLIIFGLVFFIYKDEIKGAFSRFHGRRKFLSNLLFSFIFFVVMFLALKIGDYIISFVSKSFNITYHSISYNNIFNDKITFDLILYIIKSIIIIPFVEVIIFVFGVNDTFEGKKGTFLSGLFYALYVLFVNYHFNGTIGFLIINALPYFIMFSILSYIYHKNSNNIVFSILALIFYTLLSGLLIIKI